MYTKLDGILYRGKMLPIIEGINPTFSVDLKIEKDARNSFTLVAVVKNCGYTSAVNVDVIVNGARVDGTAMMQGGCRLEIMLGYVICSPDIGYHLVARSPFDPNYRYDKKLQITVTDSNGDGCSFISDIHWMIMDAAGNGI